MFSMWREKQLEMPHGAVTMESQLVKMLFLKFSAAKYNLL